jgi:hypothetical protein
MRDRGRSAAGACGVVLLVLLSFTLVQCADMPREGVLRLRDVEREAAWKATQEVLRSHYSQIDADPSAGTFRTDYEAEKNPLYRHRLTARVGTDEEGKSVVELRIIREKLSSGFKDYGEAFEKGTWVRIEDDGALEQLLLQEIADRLGSSAK